MRKVRAGNDCLMSRAVRRTEWEVKGSLGLAGKDLKAKLGCLNMILMKWEASG